MKRLLSLLLCGLLCLGLLPAALANAYDLPGFLLSLFERDRAYDGYTCKAISERTPSGNYVYFIMGNGEHNELFIAIDTGSGWAITDQSTRAVHQPGEQAGQAAIEAIDGGFRLSYPGERYDFELGGDSWTLTRADFDLSVVPFTFTLDDQGFRLIMEGGGERVAWAADLINLNLFNIALMPKSPAQVRQYNGGWAMLPKYVFGAGHVGSQGGGKADVYSAPQTGSYRAAGGKASVSLADELWVLGEEDGWTLVYYEIEKGRGRAGYVQPGTLAVDTAQLRLGRVPVTLREATGLTDDPWATQAAFAQLPAGAAVTGLAALDPYYAYIETQVEGKTARGFVPLGSVVGAAGEGTVIEALVGTWKLDAGGTMFAEVLAFAADGTMQGYYDGEDGMTRTPTRAGRWQVQRYDPVYALFWNDPAYMLTIVDESGVEARYGLIWYEDEIHLTDFEGGGGFLRER